MVDFNGKIEIEDKTNKIVSRIVITDPGNALMNGMFGLFSKNENKDPIDKNEIKLRIFKRVGAEKVVFSEGSGNFSRYLQIDKKVYFAHSKISAVIWKAEELSDRTLPSSSILRKEIELIKSNKLEEAQQ